jgi:nucleoside-diphosphate-sugar epimerase
MQLAEKITGVPLPPLRMAPAAMKAFSAMMGVVEKGVPVPADWSAEYLRVNAGVTYIGDNSKARRELGYSPRSLEEGLRQTLLHEMRLLGDR